MKNITVKMVLFWLCLASTASAQQIHSAYFMIEDFKSHIRLLELTVQDFIITIDGEGNIIATTSLRRSDKQTSDIDFDIYGRPSPNQGLKIEEYNDFDNNKAGKIKSINGIDVDYYSNFDIHDIPGKIKSIGNIIFKYNNSFDIHDQQGTLKSIGNINIKYNTNFDLREIKGTLKSIGPVEIGWHTGMQLGRSKGRIKFIRGNTRAVYVAKLTGHRGFE
ncbi:hypothetical protein [Pedobacter psychroterrae]|uniref:Uncharacterized protein n=1 Tax=Pedobacter psychroterrae TaxID=2530453 RepID=A0A4R0NIE1_9SPHI|nr:hypothetical protein [Pedobacter psychroterrae]TCD00391.1 hypothetical protein EZ437_14290 [Pedobacter psychroterrae]